MRKAGTSQSRRSVLAAGGATLATAVAGCNGILGGDGSGDGSGDDSGTGTTTDPTPTPELPNVEQRIVERDRAAIAHVYTTVEGRVSWPEFRTVSTAPDPVLGDWQAEDARLLLRRDETFVLETDGRFTGDYLVRDDRLVLAVGSNEPSRFRYEVDSEASPPTLTLVRSDGFEIEFERTERIPASDDAVERVRALEVVREEGSSPDDNSDDLSTGGNGSGFVVSPDGYLVTNAHVVQAHQESSMLLYRRMANLTLQGIRQGLDEGGLEVTDVEREQIEEMLLEKLLAYYREQATLGNVTKRVRALNGRADPDDDLGVRSWQASIEAVGEVVRTVDGEQSWGRDVAILQVPQTDLQTVTLGSSEGLSTGADVYVIGYPNIGIQDQFEERSDVLEPTLTTGVVSQRRQLRTGIDSIQTDADINNGNSGGPIYDRNGEVVGIATFGPPDAGIQGIDFGLPIEVVQPFMDDVGIENRSGPVDQAFDAGIEAYWRGDCETATAEMETVLERNPDHPWAGDYVDDCEAGRAPGQNG